MYKETAEFICGEIMKKRISVIMNDEHFSHIDYSVNGKGDIVEESTINALYLVNNNSREQNLYKKFEPEQAGLILQYGSDLFVILHELGHAKTVIGLSLPAIYKKKAKVDAILDHREQSRAYRDLPTERRADKWAFNWLLKHPKQAEYYRKMLELARQG
jgi:hypothetical protein